MGPQIEHQSTGGDYPCRFPKHVVGVSGMNKRLRQQRHIDDDGIELALLDLPPSPLTTSSRRAPSKRIL
jgi:hypothetical protein